MSATKPIARPHFASALSVRPESRRTIEEATDSLLEGLGGETPDLVCAFVSLHHGPAIETLGAYVQARTGSEIVMGCTGETIIGDRHEVEEGPALSLFAAVLPETELTPFRVTADQDADTEIWTFDGLPAPDNPSAAQAILLADPFTFPAAEYLRELESSHPGLAVVGGMASGGMGPGQNLLMWNETVLDGGAIGITVEGKSEIVPVVSQGCRPIGKPYVITDLKDNFILKLSGRSAVDALRETLGETDEASRELLRSQPFLGVAVEAAKSEFTRGDFLVRGILGFQPQLGGLAVADGSLRRGQTVQFLVRDAVSAGEDLKSLVRARVGPEGVAGDPLGALMFSCNGRGTRMFSEADHDIGCLQQTLGRTVPTAGFFAMGEVGPVGGRNFVHGFTASLAVFRERR